MERHIEENYRRNAVIGIILAFKQQMIPFIDNSVTGRPLVWIVHFKKCLRYFLIYVEPAVFKGINKLARKKEETPAAPPAPSNEEKLLTEIRDLLKNK